MNLTYESEEGINSEGWETIASPELFICPKPDAFLVRPERSEAESKGLS